MLTTPHSQDGAPLAAMAVLSTGYRPLTSCPRSGLERSDFVLWHIADDVSIASKVHYSVEPIRGTHPRRASGIGGTSPSTHNACDIQESSASRLLRRQEAP